MSEPRAYYNEIEPYAAQWIRNLVVAGLVARGDVDTRSIVDVRPSDLDGYTQCHFFAGIGIWSAALRQAGWPDDRPIWTGSCPCQPFSPAGKGKGFADERHLWPAWHHLIRECRPAAIFGEQVASKDGCAWLDLVQADLEGTDYACGAVITPSAGFGAPHGRHRIWFMAHADGGGWPTGRQGRQAVGHRPAADADSSARDMGDAGGARSSQRSIEDDERRPIRIEGATLGSSEPVRGFWRGADWIWHRDGRYRAVEAGTFPLADGDKTRVGRIRAYGNAINQEAAAEFIAACCATEQLNTSHLPNEGN